MRWADEQFIKVYTRDSVNWLALSYDARSLLLHILRKVDRAGLMHLGRHGKRAVAVIVGAPELWESRLAPALEELLADGCCQVEGDRLVVPKYVEAQAARQSDTARKAAQRQRDREQALANGDVGSVTGLDIQAAERRRMSRGVTQESHDDTPAVTHSHAPSHAVTPRIDETRREETREDLAGSEARPPVSDNSAELHPEDEAAVERLGPNPSEAPNGSGETFYGEGPPAGLIRGLNHPKIPESSQPQLALVAQEGPQEPCQRTKTARPMPEDLQALWNELAPPKGLQRWEAMSPARKRSAQLSLAAVPDLARWRAWLTVELERPFNLGDGVKGAWKADVDWLLRAKTRDLVADFNPAAAPAPKAEAKPQKWMVL